MKLSKTKVVALALAVCLIAILSMGSLAWFTDDDSVTNDFFIAGSEDQDPDEVFSIDVWEDKDPIDNGEDKIQDGIDYEAILPGDDLYKEVNLENTGAYDQYVRAIVTVSDAGIWQQLNGEVFVPLEKIATDLNTKFQTWSIEYNADLDTLTYVLYFDEILPAEGADIATLFTNIHIPEALTREQAAKMAGGFVINVVAEAVQTEHVGTTAPEAFATVGMAIEAGNRGTAVTTPVGVLNALAVNADVVLEKDINMAGIEWTPAGTKEAPYTGTFDGNGYTISNLTISDADAEYGAMFGYLGNGATVKNVKFENANVTGKDTAVVAFEANGATIEGVEVLSGTVKSSKYYAAGIVVQGQNTTVKNCKNYATIDGTYLGAGIAAWLPKSTIEGCENYGDVIGVTERAAGIVALTSGTVTNCVNNGNVTANGSMPAGGIVAVVNGETTITGCTNNGDVTATKDSKWNASAAGILGHTPSAKVTITNCANTGKITSAYSVAAGIGVSQYGGITAEGCTNSGVISGKIINKIGNDEIVAAKGMFGGTNTIK